MAKKIYIRPSLITKFDECPAAADLQYNKKVKSDEISANLVFGTAVHDAIGKFLESQAAGMKFDPVSQFQLNWDEAVQNSVVKYNSQMKAEDLRATGERLCQLFPQAWEDSGLIPLVDEKGFVIERKLQYEILPNVILTGTPDIIVMNADGEVIVLDFKTPANPSSETFLNVSDQLTAYQILVENTPSLGVDEVSHVGFMELLKKKIPKTSRGKGPEVKQPSLGKRRNQGQIDAFIQKVGWIADDMRQGRFPKRPRMAFNSPCDMCEYKAYCHEGDAEGLIFPDKAANAA